MSEANEPIISIMLKESGLEIKTLLFYDYFQKFYSILNFVLNSFV